MDIFLEAMGRWLALLKVLFWPAVAVMIFAFIYGCTQGAKEKKQEKRRALASAKRGRGEGERGTDGMTKAERGQYWTEQARREKQRERQEQAWRDD